MSLQSKRIDLIVKHCLLAALLAIAIAPVAMGGEPAGADDREIGRVEQERAEQH